MALDSLQKPPSYLAPKADRPELLVDEYRLLLMDPATNTLVGRDGGRGMSGRLGRLMYAERTPSSRNL